jgi:ferritin-like metal-binding protein YciE
VKANSLRELYVEQLKDLYDAEQQLIKALPKLAEASSSDELRIAFEEHLDKTGQHAQRIEQIFEGMGKKAKAQKCKGMEGLLKEGSEILKEEEDIDGEVKDAALIAAAQRVEHYEIAGYGTVRTYANLLGEDEAANLLQRTLDEEKEADQTLNQIAEQINVEAGHGEVEEEEGAVRRTRTPTRRKPAA